MLKSLTIEDAAVRDGLMLCCILYDDFRVARATDDLVLQIPLQEFQL